MNITERIKKRIAQQEQAYESAMDLYRDCLNCLRELEADFASIDLEFDNLETALYVNKVYDMDLNRWIHPFWVLHLSVVNKSQVRLTPMNSASVTVESLEHFENCIEGLIARSLFHRS